MSWNGNDLFNSTLMGGMPSGADPHQYLTTDGNGKPHWEDKLAYAETEEVVILPTTDVGTIFYSQKTVACPHNGAVKVGDTGYLYVDGTPYKYTAIEKVFGGGPPVVVQLDVEGQSNTGCLIGLTDDNKLLFYTCAYGSPMATHTVSMTHNSRTLKTFDADLMGKNAGANKVLATDENGEAVWSDSLPSGSGGGGGGVIYINDTASYQANAYADAACTEWLTYEQGKAIMSKPYVISAVTEGYDLAVYAPILTLGIDAEKMAGYMAVTDDAEGNAKCERRTLVFSDSPT